MIRLLTVDDLAGWEKLYNKYSALMYGCILKITSNQKISNQIFQEVFINLRYASIPKNDTKPFSFWLWQYTGIAALHFMKKNNIEPQHPINAGSQTLDYLCFNKKTVKEASSNLELPEKEIRKQVQLNLIG